MLSSETPIHRTWVLHRHDFVEIFWIEEGELRHHINGREELLQSGTLLFIRAEDIHGFCADDRCRMITIALPAEEEARLRRSYASDLPVWPWRPEGEPARFELSRSAFATLAEAGRTANRPGQRRLDVDSFATTLLLCCAPPQGGPALDPLPPWLADAITALDLNPLVAEGLPALLRLCGRSPDHVARCTRRHLGCTPGELVNRLRAERAVKLLRFHQASISEAARQVGLPNLGHFYRVFRERYGTTPKRYCREG